MKGQGMGAFPALPSGFFKICRINSQQAGLPETVVAEPTGISRNAAQNHVVMQLDIDGFGRFPELPGLCEATDYGNWTTARLARRA